MLTVRGSRQSRVPHQHPPLRTSRGENIGVAGVGGEGGERGGVGLAVAVVGEGGVRVVYCQTENKQTFIENKHKKVKICANHRVIYYIT